MMAFVIGGIATTGSGSRAARTSSAPPLMPSRFVTPVWRIKVARSLRSVSRTFEENAGS